MTAAKAKDCKVHTGAYNHRRATLSLEGAIRRNSAMKLPHNDNHLLHMAVNTRAKAGNLMADEDQNEDGRKE